MTMSEEILQSVISRCRASTVKETISRWGRLNSAQLNNRIFTGTKKQINLKILKLIEESNLNVAILGDLELLYMQLHSRRKLWRVYKLTGKNLHLNLDPRTLRAKVFRHLQLEWKNGQVFGNMGLYAGGVWLRMHMATSRPSKAKEKRRQSYNHNSSVFVVTFPGSPYFILSRAGVKHVELMTKAMITASNADGLVDIQLSGQHLASLADIVLKKNGQLQSSRYREMEEKENPFIEKVTRKRKAPEEEEETDDQDDNIIDEDRKEKLFRRERVAKVLGSQPQPVLEKLEYSFNIKFHGKPVIESMCKSTVVIKGKSVLDGLCDMAKCGLLKFPMPAHLTTIASSAQRNTFTIQSKS